VARFLSHIIDFILGVFDQGKKYLVGGYGWAWCFVTEVQRISLEIMTLLPSVTNCESAKGVPVTVTGVAQVKIMTESEEYLSTACEQFLGKSEDEIKELLLETFEGHLRAIVGTMEVEELFQDRESFAHNVREVAATDVSKMGIKILSFTIKDLKDAEGYLDAIGQEQTANIKSKANIERAEADKDAYVREQDCEKTAMDTKYQVDTQIADYEKDFKTKKAEYMTVVNTAQAESALAYELQSSKQQQLIIAEELHVALVEKQLSIQVEEKEIIRAEKELTATTRLPADARAYETRVLAEGSRLAKLKAAEGEAQKIRLLGAADASAIEAIGKAEASEMELKASAYKDYGDAATMKLVLDALPKLAAEVAAPLSKVDEIVIVGGGGMGSGGMVDETTKLLAELPQTVKAVSGYDISGLVGKIPGAVKVK
jgi:flotillin